MKKILLAFCIIPISLASMYYIHKVKKNRHCVYKTLMNEDPVRTDPINIDRVAVDQSVTDGLLWLKQAQQKDGGWGCGSHGNQRNMNPHDVPTDPATTAVVAAALLRSGSSLDAGPYKAELSKAVDYLLNVLYYADPHDVNITKTKGTQIQSKLGQNIDLVLTTQFLTTLAEELPSHHKKRSKILSYLDGCVDRIELAQDDNGKLSGGTWAGVLQSSFANSALETADKLGVSVDSKKLKASRSYQESNYQLDNNEVKTADGAGIMLYSVSGSARAAAGQAKSAREMVLKAKEEGLIDDHKINTQNLLKAGASEKDAIELNTSYQIYNAAKLKAQKKDVTSGFGNNGGEEFLSFLQTGESLLVNEDPTWTNWYNNVSKRMMDIQNADGSWNGHHCITSPVFCTATCVSILSIEKDMAAMSN